MKAYGQFRILPLRRQRKMSVKETIVSWFTLYSETVTSLQIL